MFARTQRLLLRPGFPEDAPALAAAIADERIVKNLSGPPWPFHVRHAEEHLARTRDRFLPSLLITERTDSSPRIIGECGITRRPSGAIELGYWVSPKDWGRGIATEACMALIDIARTLKLAGLEASHFLDNPASGRVLEKLGFVATGIVAPRLCRARREDVPAKHYRLKLAQALRTPEPAVEGCLAA